MDSVGTLGRHLSAHGETLNVFGVSYQEAWSLPIQRDPGFKETPTYFMRIHPQPPPKRGGVKQSKTLVCERPDQDYLLYSVGRLSIQSL
jgi:hypothetical protein